MTDGLDVLALAWSEVFGYELVGGNPLWRFLVVLVVVALTLLAGRVLQRGITTYAGQLAKRKGETYVTVGLGCLANPVYVAVFAMGVFCAKLPLLLSPETSEAWTGTAQTIGAIALTYALYRLVDVVEFGLRRLAVRTETRLDDMFVPVIQTTLRIVIAVIAVLLVSERLLGQHTVILLLWVAVWVAGVGGLAIALAAKGFIADFLGSVAILTERPFETGHLVKIKDCTGEVENVGFRSTRLRTTDGHLVTLPNSMVTDSAVENLAFRPFTRRVANVTIAAQVGQAKAARAVEVIKDILAAIHEVNAVPDQPPRAYLSDFKAGALDILVIYVVKPADPWLFHEINERVNLDILRRFEREGIALAVPTQTVYVKKESQTT